MADEHPESDRCEHIGEAMPDIAGVGVSPPPPELLMMPAPPY